MNNHIIAFLLFAFLFSAQLSAQEMAVANTVANPAPQKTNTVAEEKGAPTLSLEAAGFDLAKGQSAASFPALESYAAEHLEYPKRALRRGVEGRVELLLTISATGKVLDAKVLTPLGHGCDQAATDMVMDMPRWTPANNYGIAVKGKKIVQVDFRLR